MVIIASENTYVHLLHTIDIFLLDIDGTINPVLVDYIARGIDQAEEENAAALIIKMDTPGGLDTTMREIIQLMDDASVPTIIYVPSGARAASAGFFITIGADVAAMAPDSAIGAASPVAMSSEGEAELSDTMKAMIKNRISIKLKKSRVLLTFLFISTQRILTLCDAFVLRACTKIT